GSPERAWGKRPPGRRIRGLRRRAGERGLMRYDPHGTASEASLRISLARRERVDAERGWVREGRRPGPDRRILRTLLQDPCAAVGSQRVGRAPPAIAHDKNQRTS